MSDAPLSEPGYWSGDGPPADPTPAPGAPETRGLTPKQIAETRDLAVRLEEWRHDPYLVGYDPEEHVGTAPEHALHFDPDCEECAYLARPTRETLGATSREAGPGCLHHDLAGNPAHVPGCPEAATSREAGLDAILHDFDLRASKEYNRSESSRAIWAEAAALVRARLATSPAEHTGDEGG